MHRARNYTPLAVGLVSALALFALFYFGLLSPWSANSDNPNRGYDYFGWPRAALAIRNGTNPFIAHDDYPDYGPWATPWVSFPTLAVAGVPLSYLSPWAGYWAANLLALALHLAIIFVFGRRIAAEPLRGRPDLARNCLFMASMGFFVPWAVMDHMGQYHSVAVLAVFLVLGWENRLSQVAGFTISALGKPVLAPAALVLVIRREWRTIAIITAVLLVTMGPWFILRHDASGGLEFGFNPIMRTYLGQAGDIAKYSGFRWNQQISLAAALDEIVPPEPNLKIRYDLLALILVETAIVAWRRNRQAAICLSIMSFFAFYARGHEYHYTLMVPVMMCLWSLPGGRYRTWWMLLLAISFAAPTTWIIFKYWYGFSDPVTGSCDQMLAANPVLYYGFLWQKPATALLLAATIAWTEVNTPTGDIGLTNRRLKSQSL
ncbi:hypothetical protein LLG95_02800 [bacterium]|nr:hypothetical protein [bacterium]